MILTLDAGNTRLKWGLRRDGAWAQVGALPIAAVDTLAEVLGGARRPERILVANVAGSAVQAAIEDAGRLLGCSAEFIHACAEQCSVRSSYDDPAQLGADRWAALIAAHHAERGHKLVVNAGTALTIDALADDGHFLGGLIVPGPALMRRSLDRGTAGLRLTDGEFQDFPAATPDAITTGAIQAGVGAIARLGESMAARGLAPTRIVLSGGAAMEMAPHLPIAHAIHENLVLDGLALIARSA